MALLSIVSLTLGSGYVTSARARAYGGYSSEECSDADLAVYIQQASRQLVHDIATKRFNVRLSGLIDGSNAVYMTPDPYIADRNVDSSVTTADVVVRGVKTSTDGSVTRSTLTVSAVDATSGKLTLSSAPTTTLYDWLEADYECYRAPVYAEDLERATAALTAHMVEFRNKKPGTFTVAQLRGSGGELGWGSGGVMWSQNSRWLMDYRNVVQRIRDGELRGTDDRNINEDSEE